MPELEINLDALAHNLRLVRRQEQALPELHRRCVEQMGQRDAGNAEMAEADDDSFAVRFI